MHASCCPKGPEQLSWDSLRPVPCPSRAPELSSQRPLHKPLDVWTGDLSRQPSQGIVLPSKPTKPHIPPSPSVSSSSSPPEFSMPTPTSWPGRCRQSPSLGSASLPHTLQLHEACQFLTLGRFCHLPSLASLCRDPGESGGLQHDRFWN